MQVPPGAIDCDIHPAVPSTTALLPYLPEYWHDQFLNRHIERSPFTLMSYPPNAPITALWFATVYAYWKCLDGRAWPWQAGVVFGLALATKHNALLLPFALGIHYIAMAIRAQGWRDAWRFRSWRVIVSLAVLAPAVLYLLWPRLWTHPIEGVTAWLKFHTTHVH